MLAIDVEQGEELCAQEPQCDGAIDLLTGQPVPNTPQEHLVQRLIRSLMIELGVDLTDISRDISVQIGKHKYRLTLAVFLPGTPHSLENATHIVVATLNRRGSRTWTNLDQINRGLSSLKALLIACPNGQIGLWTDGLDAFYLKRTATNGILSFQQVAGWTSNPTVLNTLQANTDPDLLRDTFESALNCLYSYDGLSRENTLWQFVYLLLCKQFDERRPRDQQAFLVAPDDPYSPEGQQRIRSRLERLFSDLQAAHPALFPAAQTFKLSDYALAHLAALFSRFCLSNTNADAKGLAYQAIMGAGVRSDRGQFFTPRGVVMLAVNLVAPQPHEVILDPSCGTGGFLSGTIQYWQQQGIEWQTQNASLRGIEIDKTVAQAARWNLAINGISDPRIDWENTLAPETQSLIPPRSVDVILSNPPFGLGLAVRDSTILAQFELAHQWKRQPNDTFKKLDKLQPSVVPEVLFLERAYSWLKPGGRMAIVLPNSFCSNSSFQYARDWMLERFWLLANTGIPIEAFLVEAGVSVKTELLLLCKKTAEEIELERQLGVTNNFIFMAIAEKIGVDRRGNPLYKRDKAGNPVFKEHSCTYQVQTDGMRVEREIRWKERMRDDDFPLILHYYEQFRQVVPSPSTLCVVRCLQLQMVLSLLQTPSELQVNLLKHLLLFFAADLKPQWEPSPE